VGSADDALGAGRHRTQVDAGGQLILASHVGGYQVVSALVALIFLALWLLAVGYQVVCWRRSAGEARQQLNWLMAGGAVALISFVVAAGLDAGHGVWPVLSDVVLIGVAALPAGMGVAILKYRLYEIDRIISRTLAYAIVTGVLVGVYSGLVLLARQVFSGNSPVAVAASTLAAAALFTPLRRWVQRVVDRRFNRVRYDADRMVEAFAARLKDATDRDMVRQDLAGTVSQAMEPAHVSLWTSPDLQPRQGWLRQGWLRKGWPGEKQACRSEEKDLKVLGQPPATARRRWRCPMPSRA
jgi:hypothetical protein